MDSTQLKLKSPESRFKWAKCTLDTKDNGQSRARSIREQNDLTQLLYEGLLF